ncbi:MAG TPA: PilW family protein [Myxococcota bacterium]|nr:PilW family protein [Myxococcota bacterium]
MSARHPHTRGATLIELMISLSVGLVLTSSVVGIMYGQSMGFIQRQDEVDAHQNARVALNVMGRYIRQARWGLASDVAVQGPAPLGMCYSTVGTVLPQGQCNDVDTVNGIKVDRLRAISILNDSEYVNGTGYGSAADCNSTSPVDTSVVHVNQNPAMPFASGALAAISGACFSPVGGVTSAFDLVSITSDAGFGDSCLHRYRFSRLDGSGSALSCVNGYDSAFSFGRAVVADLYIASDAAANPRLMLRLDPRTPLGGSGTYVVAFGVENLQVSYGIDASQPPDRVPDNSPWCDDPRSLADGGTCNLLDPQAGSPYTTAQLYNRIVAVKLQVGVRTDAKRPVVVGSSDGRKHWTYSKVISLRNNHL